MKVLITTEWGWIEVDDDMPPHAIADLIQTMTAKLEKEASSKSQKAFETNLRELATEYRNRSKAALLEANKALRKSNMDGRSWLEKLLAKDWFLVSALFMVPTIVIGVIWWACQFI